MARCWSVGGALAPATGCAPATGVETNAAVHPRTTAAATPLHLVLHLTAALRTLVVRRPSSTRRSGRVSHHGPLSGTRHGSRLTVDVVDPSPLLRGRPAPAEPVRAAATALRARANAPPGARSRRWNSLELLRKGTYAGPRRTLVQSARAGRTRRCQTGRREWSAR